MVGINEDDLYSAEQVAEYLGLHVRTVRNYIRDGRLNAVRIGKQYRIARADLEALTGRAGPAEQGEGSAPPRHVEASTIVHIDAVGPEGADRLSTLITAGAKPPRDTPDPLRIQTSYDKERARMTIVILGGAGATADILQAIESVTATANNLFLPHSHPETRRG